MYMCVCVCVTHIHIKHMELFQPRVVYGIIINEKPLRGYDATRVEPLRVGIKEGNI